MSDDKWPSRSDTSEYIRSLAGEAAMMAERVGLFGTAKKLLEAMREAEDDR